jgi:Protein of unknown function (DUF3017)
MRHSGPGVRGTGATGRSGKHGGAAGRAGSPVAGPLAVVPYLAVLACVAVGLYFAWHQGSQGGGRGAMLAGGALLAAAVVRLALPGRMAGLLACRHRAIDVLTLTVFGAGLLAAGLVLPRLGPLSAQGKRPARR